MVETATDRVIVIIHLCYFKGMTIFQYVTFFPGHDILKRPKPTYSLGFTRELSFPLCRCVAISICVALENFIFKNF